VSSETMAFCCNLLTPTAFKRKIATCIGYTVEPERRREYNGGKTGGAQPTKELRPWDMVCVVHGFRDAHDALSCKATGPRAGRVLPVPPWSSVQDLLISRVVDQDADALGRRLAQSVGEEDELVLRVTPSLAMRWSESMA
jgi:hypothetical protein